MSRPSPYAGSMSRSGADLALLLLSGYRLLVDQVVTELAEQGFTDFRQAHEFALRSIASGAENASSLGRRLGVSKQAAAKTITVLTERGYVVAGADPADARRKRLAVTPLGFAAMRQGEAIFERLRGEWSRRLGPGELETLEAALTKLVGDAVVQPEAPGWVGSAAE